MQRLQEGYNTNDTVVARPLKNPESPVLQGYVGPQWCPQQRKRHPKGTATITTDKALVEAFARLSTYMLHALDQGSSPLSAASASLLAEEAWHSPRHHHTPPTSTCQPSAPPPW
jgi:hypothetical protein